MIIELERMVEQLKNNEETVNEENMKLKSQVKNLSQKRLLSGKGRNETAKRQKVCDEEVYQITALDDQNIRQALEHYMKLTRWVK